MIYYNKEKKWEERFYDGVVTEVGDSVLREWDDEDFLQVKVRVDFGDGSHEVTPNAHTVFASHTTMHTLFLPHTMHTHHS